MRNFFDAGTTEELKGRIARLEPDSQRQWGKMDVAQAVAHCGTGMEERVGTLRPPRMPIGRLLGPLIKRMALRDDAPMRRNSPTVPGFVVADKRDLEAERQRLYGLMDRVTALGPSGCSTHPHAFFGHLTPEEWGVLMYKHFDHHLRQFGV